MINLGLRRASSGNREGAAEAFERAATSANPRYNVRGALHLWIVRSELNDRRAADEAYLLAADLCAEDDGSDEEKSVAEKSLKLGTHIAAYQREFVRPARLLLRRSMDSGDSESVPLAAMGLAGLEWQDLEESHGVADASASGAAINRALQRVIDTGHPDYVPVAAEWLAFSSEQSGNIDTARIALRAAMDSHKDSSSLKHACAAALDVGKVCKRKGHAADAITALRFVVENSQKGMAVIAAEQLGEVLAAQGDSEGAREAYQLVLDRTTFPYVVDRVRSALDRL
ncbi:tetratricopeptide repeat protein [Streptomyces sp. NBC_00286]|uniref:tetratricopeptide repeat protein n=1 Tax=Streptomyces sp. NBC_00286 TaxID=2975701 RepID=UPI002E2AA7BF|nr:tetratricopeptide repeat protein [Streptomyces sp. NBC_00286]